MMRKAINAMEFIHYRDPVVVSSRGLFILFVSCFLCMSATAQTLLSDGVEASVNGQEISSVAVDIIAAQMGESSDSSVARSSIVDQLINLAVLTQAAESSSLHEQAFIVETLRLQYEQTLANAYVNILVEKIDVSDAEIRAEYQAQLDSVEPIEFKVSHILLDTQEEAIEIITSLDSGEDFAELAMEFSTDSSSAFGGDLGWVNLDDYIPEFKSAIEALEIGLTSTEPFETEYGWHVVKLYDFRGPPPPDYEDVKSDLKGAIVNRKVNDIVAEMRAQSDVIIR